MSVFMELAKYGYVLVPVMADRIRPPCITGWHQSKPSGADEVKRWLKIYKGCNIGIVNYGLLVMDIHDSSCQWWQDVRGRIVPLNPMMVKAGKGGLVYFKCEERLAYRINRDVLVQANTDEYTLAPGSVVDDVKYQSWSVKAHSALPEAPGWLIELCSQEMAFDGRITKVEGDPEVANAVARNLGLMT